jgi:hypothetical protein
MRGGALLLMRGSALPLVLCSAPWAATNTCVFIGPLKHWGTKLPLTLGGARPFLLSGLPRLVLLIEEVDDESGASPDWYAWNGIQRYGRCVAA